MGWTCEKCGTTFMYHPKPCPICPCLSFDDRFDRAALKEACLEIGERMRKDKKDRDEVSLGDVARVKK